MYIDIKDMQAASSRIKNSVPCGRISIRRLLLLTFFTSLLSLVVLLYNSFDKLFYDQPIVLDNQLPDNHIDKMPLVKDLPEAVPERPTTKASVLPSTAKTDKMGLVLGYSPVSKLTKQIGSVLEAIRFPYQIESAFSYQLPPLVKKVMKYISFLKF